MNGKAAGEYGGDRSASAIKDWALRLLPDRVATVNKQSQARAAVALAADRCLGLQRATHAIFPLWDPTQGSSAAALFSNCGVISQGTPPKHGHLHARTASQA